MDKLNPITYFWYYDKFKGQKVFTPNFEFAKIMASKNGDEEVFVEKN
jgi:histidyl-tRNA synthetase